MSFKRSDRGQLRPTHILTPTHKQNQGASSRLNDTHELGRSLGLISPPPVDCGKWLTADITSTPLCVNWTERAAQCHGPLQMQVVGECLLFQLQLALPVLISSIRS